MSEEVMLKMFAEVKKTAVSGAKKSVIVDELKAIFKKHYVSSLPFPIQIFQLKFFRFEKSRLYLQ
jgi:isopropylmalate/homocitrate/citramalate synthase